MLPFGRNEIKWNAIVVAKFVTVILNYECICYCHCTNYLRIVIEHENRLVYVLTCTIIDMCIHC